MDWYSWLSKTKLEPTFVYEYGLAFVRNELQAEDLTYFNHEFLQSIGISIAKHRLEILKLAREEARGRANSLSRLVLAMSKTRKLFLKNIGKWGFHKRSSRIPASELSHYRNQWSGALKRLSGAKENLQQDQKAIIPGKNMMCSGPLDRRIQEKFMVTGRSRSVSGPLAGKMPNRSPMVRRPTGGHESGFMCRSPTISGPIDKRGLSPKVNYYYAREKFGDDVGAPSLWSLMFQDLKPT